MSIVERAAVAFAVLTLLSLTIAHRPPALTYSITAIRSKHELVRESLQRRGFVEKTGARSSGALVQWAWGPEMFRRPRRRCIYNHFSNRLAVGHKTNLTAGLIETYGPGGGGEVMPLSFQLGSAEQRSYFFEYLENPGDSSISGSPVWILKPGEGARGVGIELFQDPGEIRQFLANQDASRDHMASFVAQQYIASPMLVDGYKFDLRQFVLVTSLNPLTVWMLDDFYVRFATIPFNIHDLGNKFIHLTNHQIQKDSPQHGKNAQFDHDQWSSERFLEWLHASSAPSSSESTFDWTHVRAQMIRKVILALLTWPSDGHRDRTFELLGVDFLIDRSGEPWLLEINESPGLHLTTDTVKAHHSRAVEGLFQIILDDPRSAFPDAPWDAGSPEEQAQARRQRFVADSGESVPNLASSSNWCSAASALSPHVPSDLPGCSLQVGGWDLIFHGRYDADTDTSDGHDRFEAWLEEFHRAHGDEAGLAQRPTLERMLKDLEAKKTQQGAHEAHQDL